MTQTNAFAGLRPAVQPHLLGPEYASDAYNCKLFTGALESFRGTTLEKVLPHQAQTIYKWRDTAFWLSWSQRVSVAESAAEGVSRVYFTGLDAPRVVDINNMLTGPGPYPSSSYKLGVPAPTTPPTVAYAVPTDEKPDDKFIYDELQKETRFYAWTYVNQWGEESAFSPISARFDCWPVSHPTITIAPAPETGYVPITHIRLYRTATGNSGSAFLFVKEFTLAELAAPWKDIVKTSELADAAETADWVLPPTNMRGITTLPNGITLGFVDREVCASPQYVPYAYPLIYRQKVPAPVVGIAALGADAVVLTTGFPVILSGASPDALQQIRLPDMQPCLSERSITVAQGRVIYASPDGLCGISGSGRVEILTEEVFTRDQWQALGPANMACIGYETGVFVLTATGAFFFDLRTASYMPLTVTGQALYVDGYSDKLYIAQGVNLATFDTGAALPFRWVSRHELTHSATPVGAKVNAAQTPVSFKFYQDDVLHLTRDITANQGFRLPAVRGGRTYFALEGTGRVVSAGYAPAMESLIP